MSEILTQAAQLIAQADGLLITAGAGMGVDSGLPDFRGNKGFWQAYPALEKSGIDFTMIANPAAFGRTPYRAWGFYGHRLALYRDTVPHEGFSILKAFADKMAHGAFVVTSNVDGQFQKAGFSENKTVEIHGSIHRLQCSTPCHESIWLAKDLVPVTDDDQCLWVGDLPVCPKCRKLARPNILMFNDWDWVDTRASLQMGNFQIWRKSVTNLVVVELGAGANIPTIRRFSENQQAPLIRINPRDWELSGRDGISIGLGAKEALQGIRTAIESLPTDHRPGTSNPRGGVSVT